MPGEVPQPGCHLLRSEPAWINHIRGLKGALQRFPRGPREGRRAGLNAWPQKL